MTSSIISAILTSLHILAGAVLTNGQTCRNTGSLDYQEGSIVSTSTTYIMPSYRIPCDGVVTGWEYCYQIIGTPSVTFYPSVWRWNTENSLYTLVQASSMTYVIQPGPTYVCNNYTLPVDQQFAVLTNDTIGLYTTLTSQILTTSNSSGRLAYSVEGNQSSVMIIENDGFVDRHQFHIAIMANISSAGSTSIAIASSSILQTTSTIAISRSTSSSATSTSMTSSSSTSTLVSSLSTSMSSTSTLALKSSSETSTTPDMITRSTSTISFLATASTPFPVIPTASISTNSVPAQSTVPSSTTMNTAGAAGSGSSNNTGVIIGAVVGVAVAVLVALTIVLVCVVVVYKRNKSVSASYSVKTIKNNTKVTTEVISDNASPSPATDRNTLHMYDTLKYEVVIDRNSSYGAVPEQKKKKGDYDYVVCTEEMIKTDTNPSYVPISVGDNVLDDNPSYQTV